MIRDLESMNAACLNVGRQLLIGCSLRNDYHYSLLLLWPSVCCERGKHQNYRIESLSPKRRPVLFPRFSVGIS